MKTYRPKVLLVMLAMAAGLCAQTITSPNGKHSATLRHDPQSGYSLRMKSGGVAVIQQADLGICFADVEFDRSMKLKSVSKATTVVADYSAIHGKRSHPHNKAREATYTFTDRTGEYQLLLTVRAYNDGIAFRYERDLKSDSVEVTEELTAYKLGDNTLRWLQHFTPCYENPFPLQTSGFEKGQWGYPALLCQGDSWALITEAGMDRGYCATKLSNERQADTYKLTFPAESDGCGVGAVRPVVKGRWQSPWRVVIAGSLADIAESTLVDDVSRPASGTDWSWVKPGRAAWVYWSHNRGSKDYKLVCSFIDLAKQMGWEYVLIDWEWDVMGNGGKLEDALAYAREKEVKVWLWYNSGGPHNGVPGGPRDRLLTHESRVREFEWLRGLGVVGIKIDFFESDKQQMMNYYIDILEDAADAHMMINFHGCTLPRGWSRTYPHLMSMEAIFGAEQYNNGGLMTIHGAEWNTVFPFTRNVVGPMDYTPVTFTDSQHPHTTTNTHELALSIVFENGIQHMADRPEGYLTQNDEVRSFLSQVPVSWDDTRLISGYPGDHIILARRKGDIWYIAGLNGTDQERTFSFDLRRLGIRLSTQGSLFCDDTDPRQISHKALSVKAKQKINVKCQPRGGFVLVVHK